MARLNPVTSIAELRTELAHGHHDYCILLGSIRSSKHIRPAGVQFDVCNEIDGTDQLLTERELFTQSNIGAAMKYGTFYRCDWSDHTTPQ